MKNLLERDLVRARGRGEGVVFRPPVASLHPVGHAVPPDLDRRGETVTFSRHRKHVRHTPTLGRALRFHLRGFRHLAAEFHLHAHRIAVGHGLVRVFRQDELEARGRDAVEISARHQRPQEERAKAVLADHHEAADNRHDHRRDHRVALDQRHREQRGHLQTLHPGGNVRLEQVAELRRIKNVALRAAQLDRREQILAQLRLRVLDQPRDLPLVRRLQELPHALPPGDRQNRRVRRPGHHPANPVRQQRHHEIHDRHEDHRGEQHRDRREDAANDDQPPPPAGEGLEFLQNDGVEMCAQGWQV